MTAPSRRGATLACGLGLWLLLGAGCREDTRPPAAGGSGGSGGTTDSGATAGAGGSAGSGGNTPSGDGGIPPDAGRDTGDGATSDVTEGGADGSGDGSGDGNGDGDGGGGGGLKLPIQRGDLHVLEFGALVFEVKASVGARVTSFRLDGDELLTGPGANARYWGSTFWTSPADDWVMNPFDPPAIVDRDPYTVTVSADGVITATSAPFTAMGKRFTVTKVFRADIAAQAIVIDYKLNNIGATAFSLSHWEVTRVFPDGLTFFPSGTRTKVDFLPQVMQLRQAQAYTWYDNKTHVAMGGESKAGTEANGGFIAHVAPHARGDLLFVKTFADIAPTATPPGHFEVELFCSNAHSYVELEEHSGYLPIAPGQTSTQTVRWFLRRLPVGTDRSIGSSALIAAAQRAIGR